MARRVAAVFVIVMSTALLAAVVVQTVQGDLLDLKAEHISIRSVILLVAWLAASIYVAWPYIREGLR
jgi:hypothetical protein